MASALLPCCLAPLALVATATGAEAPSGSILPQCTAAEYRQFDFWLGRWSVQSDGTTIAESSIGRGAGGCAIDERYRQSDGYSGASASFYDPVLRRWRQTWVDTAGSIGEFAGSFVDGAMRFDGETHTHDGRRILRRMTLYAETPDRVRQRSEASTDGGATWRPHYDFVYIRRAGGEASR